MLVNDSSKIYNGTNEIVKIYAGSNVVYEKEEPVPYTRINYIEGTGNQYIDTGVTFNTNSIVKIKVKFNHKVAGNYAMFGNYYTSGYYRTVVTAFGGKYYFSNNNPSQYTYPYNTVIEEEYEIQPSSTRNGTFKIIRNGSVYGSGGSVGEFPNPNINSTMLLFAQQDPRYGISGVRASGQIYYFQIKIGNELVRDFIPVLDENDVPCLYDKVSKTCFYNKGTGTFLYG